MKKTDRILILLSGGADSATCLAKAVKEVGHDKVYCLNAYYGQRLDREMDCAKKLTQYYQVEYIELDISPIMAFSNCTLLKRSTEEVKHCTYGEQIREGKVITSYVPFRNGVLLSIAAAIAESLDVNRIWYGAHDDDYAYPDCSAEFIASMGEAIRKGTPEHISINAPLKGMKKKDIIAEGLKLGVPYGLTYSCYEGREKPCGKCGSCIDRIKAFELNGVKDPLEYE